MAQGPAPPGPVERLGHLALLLLFLLALAGGIALLVRQSAPRGVEILLPTATPVREVTVYLSGAVARPGVYTLREGSRLADALALAGGPAPEADLARVNLAQRLRDEDHIHIPAQGEVVTVTPGRALPLDLNTATLEDLVALPGIGEAKARAILDYREKHGPFRRVEDLLRVSGIGSATLERIRDLVVVR